MDRFLDELARSLAGPLPRRNALKIMGAALIGAIVGAFNGVVRAQVACGDKICKENQTCCTTGDTPFCITAGKLCCGDKKCDANKNCCPGIDKPFCATAGKLCCGDKKCDANKMCCTTGDEPFCATIGKICCGNKKCNENQRCVDGRCEASRD